MILILYVRSLEVNKFLSIASAFNCAKNRSFCNGHWRLALKVSHPRRLQWWKQSANHLQWLSLFLSFVYLFSQNCPLRYLQVLHFGEWLLALTDGICWKILMEFQVCFVMQHIQDTCTSVLVWQFAILLV